MFNITETINTVLGNFHVNGWLLLNILLSINLMGLRQFILVTAFKTYHRSYTPIELALFGWVTIGTEATLIPIFICLIVFDIYNNTQD